MLFLWFLLKLPPHTFSHTTCTLNEANKCNWHFFVQTNYASLLASDVSLTFWLFVMLVSLDSYWLASWLAHPSHGDFAACLLIANPFLFRNSMLPSSCILLLGRCLWGALSCNPRGTATKLGTLTALAMSLASCSFSAIPMLYPPKPHAVQS